MLIMCLVQANRECRREIDEEIQRFNDDLGGRF